MQSTLKRFAPILAVFQGIAPAGPQVDEVESPLAERRRPPAIDTPRSLASSVLCEPAELPFEWSRAMLLGDCKLLNGFYPLEHDDEGPFAWARQAFALQPSRAAEFVRLHLCYLGNQGTLTISGSAGPLGEIELSHGWQHYLLRLPPATTAALTCHVNPLAPVAADPRELGVMLRSVEVIDDPQRFEALAALASNALLNEKEFRGGRTVLRSYPTGLRITMETRCNIPETGQACVYCAWNWAKSLEQGSPAFRPETLTELGKFYDCATHLVDCSYGEPTMNKQFGDILSAIDGDGKHLSLTTNGQMLVERRRRELVGKNVFLYVSIDSATAAGFSRYRNDRFDDIITNLRALCREKRLHNNLPVVFVSFIAMRSNMDELPQYLDLMAELGVDEVKLRALYLDDNVNAPVIVNNGYRFDYAAEVLSLAELTAITPVARELAAERGVKLYIEWEEFEQECATAPGAPLCSEPWKTLYAMRRGIMPCCYATNPLARWQEQGDRSLERFMADVFNGPAYQHLRSELAAGRLSNYCRNTPSCPVLKRMAHDQSAADLVEPTFAPRAEAVSPLPFVSLESLTMPSPLRTSPA